MLKGDDVQLGQGADVHSGVLSDSTSDQTLEDGIHAFFPGLSPIFS